MKIAPPLAVKMLFRNVVLSENSSPYRLTVRFLYCAQVVNKQSLIYTRSSSS